MNSAMPSCCNISIAVRSGICQRPSASIRNPSFKASNNSATSGTCFTSSRESINMVLFPLPFLLLKSIDHARHDVGSGLDQHHVHALKRIDDEVRYQTEFVILPFSRFNFEGLVDEPF